MFKKVFFVGVFAVLAGCDDAGNTPSNSQAVTDAKKSSTAVHFPGGGIDFKKNPIFDNSRKDETGVHIGSITFSFENSVNSVLKATAPLMLAQGYSESESKSDKCDPCMIYSKAGVDIAFAYNSGAREGAGNGSRLLIWWKDKM
ncbi:hypothetical protein [Pseudomonas leptonychotis]|uniref:hypothetical protein n=1 Tax=Pseudomonas leptonychotis TaxID=2448482 RepID=UPI0039EF6A7F